jgi:hypothetical protein
VIHAFGLTVLLFLALIAAAAIAAGVLLLTVGFIPLGLVVALTLVCYLVLACGAALLLMRFLEVTPLRLVLINVVLLALALGTGTVLSMIGGLA